MALSGLIVAGGSFSNYGKDVSLESISSISPIQEGGGNAKEALAALVGRNHYADGRESLASGDSGSAARLTALQVELEMAQTEAQFHAARMREQRVKLEIERLKSSSGSRRSRTSRSLMDRNDAASAAALAAPIRETGHPIVVSNNGNGGGLPMRLSTKGT